MEAGLVTFYIEKIRSLNNNIKEQEDYITHLETFLYELLDPDCPEEYKNVVRTEVFKE